MKKLYKPGALGVKVTGSILIVSFLWAWKIFWFDPCLLAANEKIEKLRKGKSVCPNILKERSLNSIRKNNSVVIVGASFAAGWNPGEMAGLKIINKGVGGERSIDVFSRFRKDVISLNPRAVIIWGFINDILNAKREEVQTETAKTKDNIEKMVKLAQDKEIVPILVTELTIRGPDSWKETLASGIGQVFGKESYQEYINKHVQAMNQWIKYFTKSHNIIILDFSPLLSNEEGMRIKEYATEDGIHISPMGYEKLTSYAKEFLKSIDE